MTSELFFVRIRSLGLIPLKLKIKVRVNKVRLTSNKMRRLICAQVCRTNLITRQVYFLDLKKTKKACTRRKM